MLGNQPSTYSLWRTCPPPSPSPAWCTGRLPRPLSKQRTREWSSAGEQRPGHTARGRWWREQQWGRRGRDRAEQSRGWGWSAHGGSYGGSWEEKGYININLLCNAKVLYTQCSVTDLRQLATWCVGLWRNNVQSIMVYPANVSVSLRAR